MSEAVSRDDFTIAYHADNQRLTITPGSRVNPNDLEPLRQTLLSDLQSVVETTSGKYSLEQHIDGYDANRDKLKLSTPGAVQSGSPIFSVDLSKINDAELAEKIGLHIKSEAAFVVIHHLTTNMLTRLPPPIVETGGSLGKYIIHALRAQGHLRSGITPSDAIDRANEVEPSEDISKHAKAILQAISRYVKQGEGSEGAVQAVIRMAIKQYQQGPKFGDGADPQVGGGGGPNVF